MQKSLFYFLLFTITIAEAFIERSDTNSEVTVMMWVLTSGPVS